jgi:hypothetical protein
MNPTEQLQSVTASPERFTRTLTTHQQWLSKFTFIFLHKPVVAYRFISRPAAEHLNPQPLLPIACCSAVIFTGNSSAFFT